MSSIEYDVRLLKKVVSDGYNGDRSARTSKYKIPEFKSVNGCQDAKEFDNFIQDIEQYYVVTHVPKEELVTVSNMYFLGDTKLWWWTRSTNDMSTGKPYINIQGVLKKGIERPILLIKCSMVGERQT